MVIFHVQKLKREDNLGNTFQVGDSIVVGDTKTTKPYLVIGKVISIDEVDSKGRTIYERRFSFNDSTKTYNAIFTPCCSVTISPIIGTKNFYHRISIDNETFRGIILKEENGLITYKVFNNVIKLPEESV